MGDEAVTSADVLVFLKKVERRLRKHIEHDDDRFARLEGKLIGANARLNILLVLVLALIPAVYFGAHP